MEHTEKILREETIYSCRIFTLVQRTVELENGATVARNVIRHHGGVALLALLEGDLLLVKQYRAGIERELLELPAGKLEPGEDPRQCGLRELREETGFVAERLAHLCEMAPIPPYCQEVVQIYEAQGLSPAAQQLDDDEFLTVCRVPFAEALAMVLDGRITDAKTQVGVLQYAAKHHLLEA